MVEHAQPKPWRLTHIEGIDPCARLQQPQQMEHAVQHADIPWCGDQQHIAPAHPCALEQVAFLAQ
ncbi:hypothetical protein D3C81_570170 [compost metagenome]